MKKELDIVLVTGALGLVGLESCLFFSDKANLVIGIDNDNRKKFFGEEGSVSNNIEILKNKKNIVLIRKDLLDIKIEDLTIENGKVDLIIHAAAQPSHDFAAENPVLDFEVNSKATLVMLELLRNYFKESVFIYLSTNKVYGDNPNKLNLIEKETRYHSDTLINESMSLDNCVHSIFGVNKLFSDIMTQEYGKYYNLKTTVLRCGCITGPNQSGVAQHGFLNYLVKKCIRDSEYTIIGYKGKQVRDNIHVKDLVSAFYEISRNPKYGVVYNMGGGIYSNCSILEAINITSNLLNKKIKINYIEKNRKGDHIWYVSDVDKFKNDYRSWSIKYNVEDIIKDIIKGIRNEF